MKKTAIILGATGLTGNILLQYLMNDERYGEIKLFSRSKIENLPEKVTQYIGDLFKLHHFEEYFTGNEVFCCIGTTTKKTPNKEVYKKIDYGIPVQAAKLSKKNNIETFLVISAIGANKNSSFFYNKTKGEMEFDVLKQNIENTYILRPSFIVGNRKETRIFEKIGILLFKLVEPLFLGKLKKYKTIYASNIAKAMIYLANNINYTEKIISSDTIEKLSKKNNTNKIIS